MADELYDLRNTLLVGNFHQVIAEGASIRTVKKKPEEVQAYNADRDSLIARAQLGLGQHDSVIQELRSASHPLLIATRLYAELVKEMATLPPNSTSTKVRALADAAAEVNPQQADVAVLASSGLILARDVPAALTLANKWIPKLDANVYGRQIIELRAISADAYLRLNRPDLADKEVNAMKVIDDESTLTILIGGIVSLRMAAVKPERINEAVSAFQEVTSRCGQSVTVLNLLAIANMTKGNARDAERNLLDALAKKSGDPDTVANLAMVAAQLGKPTEAINKYVANAKNATPASAWSNQYAAMEQRFADAIQN